jgi:hypothetical protein
MRSRANERGDARLDCQDGNHVGELLPTYVNGTLDGAEVTAVRAHLAGCAACQAEFKSWQAIDRAARASLSPLLLPSDDVLERVLANLDPAPRALHARSTVPERANRTFAWNERMTTMSQPEPKSRSNRLLRPIVAAAAAASLAAVVILTPVGSYAEGFLTIFTPKQFTAVTVTPGELQSLPDLNNYGTFTQNRGAKPQQVTSAAAASASTGMTVLVPGTLPSGIPSDVSYNITSGQSASFTFSAAKARAAAQGKALPAMPANIDGSSVTVTTGPAVLATYRDRSKSNPADAAQIKAASSSAPGVVRPADPVGNAVETMGPFLVIGQTTAPVVASNGASAADLEQYLLAQPGISPDLANAIRAIGDPSSTLPIPIPIDKATSHPVQVQGVNGLAVADSTGLGGGIIWQKNGIVYGVAGSLPESDLIAVANSLH